MQISTLDIHQILKLLPHRYPMLLVDRVLELEVGKRIKALKNVSINEPFFSGHFPHHPIMPGVLILEALAQTAALLTFSQPSEARADSLYYFVGIDGARFKRPVGPGDQLHLHAEVTRYMRGIWKFKTYASVDDVVVTEAELMCTVKTIES
ncbi:MAG: 3-hydroxyacyl-ACP dehydratase FabZ [Ottowia sp.]|nr:3-hydroxyacyl-ACP dehydratase FabZ [Ottowia sp.]